MKSLIAWCKDTGGWILFVIIIPILAFLYASAFFKLNNFYSRDCQAASGWWKIPGLVLTAVWIYILIAAIRKDSSTGQMIAIGVALCLALASFAGFNFSFA